MIHVLTRAEIAANYDPFREIRPDPPQFNRNEFATLRELLRHIGGREFSDQWTGQELSARAFPEGGWRFKWPSTHRPHSARHISLAPPPINALGSGRLDAPASITPVRDTTGHVWVPSVKGRARLLPLGEAVQVWNEIKPEVEGLCQAETEERRRLDAAVNKALSLLGGGQLQAWVLSIKTGERHPVAAFYWDSVEAPRLLRGDIGDDGQLPIAAPNGGPSKMFPGRAFVLRADLQTAGSGRQEVNETGVRRGTKPKYDWEKFRAALIAQADSIDGLSDYPELLVWAAEKCVEIFGDQPAESTLRDKLLIFVPHKKPASTRPTQKKPKS